MVVQSFAARDIDDPFAQMLDDACKVCASFVLLIFLVSYEFIIRHMTF